MMIFSDRAPKEKKFGMSKFYGITRYRYDRKSKIKNKTGNLVLRGTETFGHAKLREIERYGTCSTKEKAVIKAIKNNEYVGIKQNESAIIAIVRYSTRYYAVVYDWKINKIKTFLPPEKFVTVEYVQALMDKENSMLEDVA